MSFRAGFERTYRPPRLTWENHQRRSAFTTLPRPLSQDWGSRLRCPTPLRKIDKSIRLLFLNFSYCMVQLEGRYIWGELWSFIWGLLPLLRGARSLGVNGNDGFDFCSHQHNIGHVQKFNEFRVRIELKALNHVPYVKPSQPVDNSELNGQLRCTVSSNQSIFL